MASSKKHECKFCDKTFDRATDAMTHLTIDHPDRVAFKSSAERWKHRQFTCGQCYMLMQSSEETEYIKVCAHCGYSFDLRKREYVGRCQVRTQNHDSQSEKSQ